jgi:hypothetical protein
MRRTMSCFSYATQCDRYTLCTQAGVLGAAYMGTGILALYPQLAGNGNTRDTRQERGSRMHPLTSAEIALMEAFAIDISTPRSKARNRGFSRLRRQTALWVYDWKRAKRSTSSTASADPLIPKRNLIII